MLFRNRPKRYAKLIADYKAGKVLPMDRYRCPRCLSVPLYVVLYRPHYSCRRMLCKNSYTPMYEDGALLDLAEGADNDF